MASESIDKSTEIFAIRIPEITKKGLDKLPSKQKHILREQILELMARAIHNSPDHYDPHVYLCENYVKVSDAQINPTSFSLEQETDA